MCIRNILGLRIPMVNSKHEHFIIDPFCDVILTSIMTSDTTKCKMLLTLLRLGTLPRLAFDRTGGSKVPTPNLWYPRLSAIKYRKSLVSTGWPTPFLKFWSGPQTWPDYLLCDTWSIYMIYIWSFNDVMMTSNSASLRIMTSFIRNVITFFKINIFDDFFR